MNAADTTPRPTRPRVPKDPRQKAAWLLYQLNRRGLSYAEVARQLGVRRTVPRTVFDRPYPKMERQLAELLGYRPEWIWPERYDADGTPANRRSRCGRKPKMPEFIGKSTRRAKARHVEAAPGARQAVQP
jgi:Ner family transcriptional regulator